MTREERSQILKKMGFDSYAAYLDSYLWKGIRARVLKRHRRCRLCRKWASQVHHQTYSEANLRGKTLQGLASICGTCHLAIEYDGERKCGLEEVRRRFRKMLNALKWERVDREAEREAVRQNRELTLEFKAIVSG